MNKNIWTIIAEQEKQILDRQRNIDILEIEIENETNFINTLSEWQGLFQDLIIK